MSKVTEQKRDLVWLPQELADKVKQLEDGRAIEQEVISYIDRSRLDLSQQLECLDESVIQYRAAMVKAKQALREAFNNEMADFEAIWDEHLQTAAGIKTRIAEIGNELRPIKAELAALNAEMKAVATWDVKDLLSMLEDISKHLNGHGQTGEVLRFLFANYTRSKPTGHA